LTASSKKLILFDERTSSASAGPEGVSVAQVRGLRGRADRDRNPVLVTLVTNGDLARIAVKPFLSSIVGSASGWLALAGRLARDSRFAVFLTALRVLRLVRLTGRLARIFDPVIVLDPAVVPRAGLSLAGLLLPFVHSDSRLDRLFNVVGYGRLGYGSLESSGLGDGAPEFRGFRLASRT
jgi:hypothetical protein